MNTDLTPPMADALRRAVHQHAESVTYPSAFSVGIHNGLGTLRALARRGLMERLEERSLEVYDLTDAGWRAAQSDAVEVAIAYLAQSDENKNLSIRYGRGLAQIGERARAAAGAVLTRAILA
jgi:hypothetical protein